MTKKDKIVAVCKDVLSQLSKRKNTYRVTEGCYLSSDIVFAKNEGDFQESVDEVVKKNCKVCAMGATFLSKAKLFNNVPIQNFVQKTSPYNVEAKYRLYVDSDNIVKDMQDIFSPALMYEIEAAFEQTTGHAPCDMITNRIRGAVIFGEQYTNPKSRLKAIMQNIVDNGGKFVIEPLSEKSYKDIRRKDEWD